MGIFDVLACFLFGHEWRWEEDDYSGKKKYICCMCGKERKDIN